VQEYTAYDKIDKNELERDIDKIKENMEAVGEADFQHLLKMERWGRSATYSGYGLIALLALLTLVTELNTFIYALLFISAALLSIMPKGLDVLLIGLIGLSQRLGLMSTILCTITTWVKMMTQTMWKETLSG